MPTGAMRHHLFAELAGFLDYIHPTHGWRDFEVRAWYLQGRLTLGNLGEREGKRDTERYLVNCYASENHEEVRGAHMNQRTRSFHMQESKSK